MAAEQKQAVFILVAFALGVIAFLVLVPLVGTKPALGGFGLFGIGGLSPLLFRKPRDSAEPSMDERDKFIGQKAALAAGVSAFEAFVAACMAPWFVQMISRKELISIRVLPLIVFIGGITFISVWCAVVLVLHARTGESGEE